MSQMTEVLHKIQQKIADCDLQIVQAQEAIRRCEMRKNVLDELFTELNGSANPVPTVGVTVTAPANHAKMKLIDRVRDVFKAANPALVTMPVLAAALGDVPKHKLYSAISQLRNQHEIKAKNGGYVWKG